ncbi:MAG TPA: MFS transporter [Acidimicrobiia bacterium]|nr:MFS transporter [Acidimicrobiia bacterium]
MRDYVHLLRGTGGLREPGLVSTAVLTLTAIAFFRVALLPEFGRDLSMSTFQLGAVTTVFAVGRLIADLPGGHFADRLRASSLIALSATGVALGSIVLGLSVSALTVYVAAFVLGISSSTTNATGMTFFSNVAGARHRGTSMAVFSAALLGGQAVGPAVAGLISAAGGWRLAMMVGAAAAAAMALVLLVARSRQPVPDSRAGPPNGFRSHGAKSPPLVPLLVLHSVSFAVFFTLGAVPQTLVPLIGADDLGLTTAAIGLALGLGGLARFVGALVGGWLSDRVPRKVALAPGLVMQAAGVALLAFEPTVAAWLSAIVIMSLASFAVPVAATILGDITEPTRVGSQFGRFRFVGDIGLIAGPLVVSALFESMGRATAFGLVAGVLVVPALLSWRFLPDTSVGTGEST